MAKKARHSSPKRAPGRKPPTPAAQSTYQQRKRAVKAVKAAPHTRLDCSVEAVQDILQMTWAEMQASITNARIQGGTRRQMLSAMTTITKWLNSHKLELNKINMMRFVTHCQRSKKLTIAPYLSHLQNYLRINGLDNFVDPDLLTAASQAQAANKKHFSVKKGVLSHTKFETELEPHMIKTGAPDIILFYIKLAILSRFRAYQLRQLEVGHFVERKNSLSGTVITFVTTQKADNIAGSVAKEDHEMTFEELENWQNVMDYRENVEGHDFTKKPWVFPRKIESPLNGKMVDISTAANEYIKLAASELNWPTENCTWSLHCTKHGGINDLFEQIRENVVAFLSGTGTTTISKNYAPTEAQRQRRATHQQHLRANLGR